MERKKSKKFKNVDFRLERSVSNLYDVINVRKFVLKTMSTSYLSIFLKMLKCILFSSYLPTINILQQIYLSLSILAFFLSLCLIQLSLNLSKYI